MTDTTRWLGDVGLHLGEKFYINMSGDLNDKSYVSDKMRDLQRQLQAIGIEPSSTINRNNEKRLLTGIYVFILIFEIGSGLSFTF